MCSAIFKVSRGGNVTAKHAVTLWKCRVDFAELVHYSSVGKHDFKNKLKKRDMIWESRWMWLTIALSTSSKIRSWYYSKQLRMDCLVLFPSWNACLLIMVALKNNLKAWDVIRSYSMHWSIMIAVRGQVLQASEYGVGRRRELWAKPAVIRSEPCVAQLVLHTGNWHP